VLLGGKVLTVDTKDTIVGAIAIKGGRILAVGTTKQIRALAGPKTRIIALNGKTVIPGIVAAHCHAVGVARQSLVQPHAELLAVAEVQEWIRKQAKDIPPGRWIRVPRTDITRMKERRHPTTAELDAACTTHPVYFNAARKTALNTKGYAAIGITVDTKTVPGGEIIRDAKGNLRLLSGAGALLGKAMPRAELSDDAVRSALRNVHARYNAVGITSIVERAANKEQYELYQSLRKADELTVRTNVTIRQQFRTGEAVETFSKQLGLKTGDGDDWVRVGPLKITVDGGIHWGNTHLREPYGEKRIRFYIHKDPAYRGQLNYSVEQMTAIFAAGHQLGWQMCCHVTGDAGVDRILDALEAVHAKQPLADKRFTLTHAYFPAVDSIKRAKKLGLCVDTQSSLYYKDSDAIAEVYGKPWAARFMGLGDWIRGGIPTAIAGDHMLGLDPDTAMNAYSPFLMLYVAVARKNRAGKVYGPHQKLTRRQALRCITTHAAYLAFDEKKKGTLEPGKFADLVVLDRDYLTCLESEIRLIRPRLTMLDGKIVFQAK
jgi:hypothetical protein